MTATRLVPAACLVAWACGCGGKAAPTMAGGKPVSHWVEELRSPDPKHRKEAVEKLGNVGPADPVAFPAVCGALKDTDPRVRCEAILAVLKFDTAAKESVPLLDDLRKNDRDARVREYAARAVERLQSGD